MEKLPQVIIIFQTPGGEGADTPVGLYDHGISHLVNEMLCSLQIDDLRIAGSGDTGFFIIFFHGRFGPVPHDLVGFESGRDVEVRPERGIQFHPVLVIGLDPVDLSVLAGEITHRPDHLVIIPHVLYSVVLGQSIFQPVAQAVVGSIPDSEYIDSIVMEPFTESFVGSRKIR